MTQAKPLLQSVARALDISYSERGAKAGADPAMEVLYRGIVSQFTRLSGGTSEYAERLDAFPAEGDNLMICPEIMKEAVSMSRRVRRARGG